ncbi:MAG: 30S ribosomal protein S20 [Thermodesulfobacteriota bacterium]
MAIHKSVLKRHRQSLKRQARNMSIRSSLKTIIKKLREAADKKETDNAKTFLVQAIKLIDKAASKGVIHKNNASRNISRLTRRVNALESS